MSGLAQALTVEQMMQVLELQAITFYEVRAKLHDHPRRDTENGEAEARDEVELSSNWSVRIRHVGVEFGVRILVEVETSTGEALVDVAAEYTSAEPMTIERATAFEFINHVAVMQLFPYIREAITNLTSRVFGDGILLPVIMRGQLEFSPNDDGPLISDGRVE